ncbi:MAG TPA: diacylglycerol kinase family protein [Pyrinomonadaceae bacterium]|nr:diacylglycerol kinase family protein [Pyrinomonadaceae bacterium]
MQAETFVVVNYSAARARAAWALAERVLRESGVRFDAHEARAAGDAQSAARGALRAGYRTIAVVGGDGTLGEVVTGFFEPEGVSTKTHDANAHARIKAGEKAPAHVTDAETMPARVNEEAVLAVLPGGTGNDFARGLTGERAMLEHWLKRLIAHGRRDTRTTTVRAVDVLRGTIGDDARPFFCLNAATLGIGAEVAHRVARQGNALRRFPGEARFALAAVQSLARWRARNVSVRVDDDAPFECATNLIAIANSPYAGGGMMFSPAARTDDGLLDVVTACRLTRRTLVREMTRIHSGGHVNNPQVQITRSRRVRIEHHTDRDALPVEADGDVRGHTPLEFCTLHAALKVVY